jgi:lipoprotein-anchoring transpeptidase ErfK/SrfK
MIEINIANQTLKHQNKTYSISSAKNGIGEIEGSFCTPTGKFKIAEKIGEGLEVGSVLVGRVATGEIYSSKLKQKQPDRDWILTRILWLDGMEAHNKNTKNRYIYIHGTPNETPMGAVGSKGCIRLCNTDMLELFDTVQIGENIAIIKP